MEGCCIGGPMNIVSSGKGGGGQLGQFDIIQDVFGFAAGLFTKDPNKVEYDKVRQQAWDSLVALVGSVEEHKSTGTLSRSTLQAHIDAVTELMKGFKAYTDRMYNVTDRDWIEPRFHDYYDWMGKIKNEWQALMATIPAEFSDYIPDFFGGGVEVPDVPDFPNIPSPTTIHPAPNGVPSRIAGMDTTSMLLIGGVLAGLYFMSKRKRG